MFDMSSAIVSAASFGLTVCAADKQPIQIFHQKKLAQHSEKPLDNAILIPIMNERSIDIIHVFLYPFPVFCQIFY